MHCYMCDLHVCMGSFMRFPTISPFTHTMPNVQYIIIFHFIDHWFRHLCGTIAIWCIYLSYHTLSSRRISHRTISITIKFIIANNTNLSIFYKSLLYQVVQRTLTPHKNIDMTNFFYYLISLRDKFTPNRFRDFTQSRLSIIQCNHKSFIVTTSISFGHFFVQSRVVIVAKTAIINFIKHGDKIVLAYKLAYTHTFLIAYVER